jgi:hypothetical protein
MPTENEQQELPAPDPAIAAASGAENDQEQVENAGDVEVEAQDSEPKPAEAAKVEEPAPEPKPKNPVKPFQARIDELTKARREEERRAQAAEARAKAAEDRIAAMERGEQQEPEPQRAPDGYVPKELVDAEVERRANEKARQDRFDADANAAYTKGVAAHKDFDEAIRTLASLAGDSYQAIIAEALVTDAPHEVLYALGSDPEEIDRIRGLSPAKRIAEFTKMTLKPSPKPQASKAAAPIQPVNGNTAKDFDFNDPDADDAEWHARMDRIEREQRATRR